jgi:hypothetical protein
MAFRRWYALPNDFVSFWGPLETSTFGFGTYVSPAELLWRESYYTTTGTPTHYTIMPLQDSYGTLGIYLQYIPDAAIPVNFIYKRRPRTIRYSGHESNNYAGTISVTLDSATVTGIGTAFGANHPGSILRIGSSTTSKPTGLEGIVPFEEQRSIASVTSAESLTLDAAVQTTRSGVKYVISDPLDIEVGAYQLFLALCKRNMAYELDLKSKRDYDSAFRNMLGRAKCGDTRVQQRRVCGYSTYDHRRLADSPRSLRGEE